MRCRRAAARDALRWRGGVLLTLVNLLAAVDLGNLLLEELVTLLANLDDLSAGDAKLRDLSEDLLGDLASSLVLGQSIRVVEGVICKRKS